MPKGTPSTDARVNEFRRMNGAAFAMRVATDMLLLEQEERAKALRMLGAINETVDRETEALAAK
jgi:hypothetical protein